MKRIALLGVLLVTLNVQLGPHPTESPPISISEELVVVAAHAPNEMTLGVKCILPIEPMWQDGYESQPMGPPQVIPTGFHTRHEADVEKISDIDDLYILTVPLARPMTDCMDGAHRARDASITL